MPTPDNPDSYTPHVDTDALLRGDELRDGLVVRPEGTLRFLRDGGDRWATIHRVTFTPPNHRHDVPAQVSFIRTYADGSLASWSGAVDHWWIVRKDGKMPAPDAPLVEPTPEPDDRLDAARRQGQQDVVEWLRGSGRRTAGGIVQYAIANGELP